MQCDTYLCPRRTPLREANIAPRMPETRTGWATLEYRRPLAPVRVLHQRFPHKLGVHEPLFGSTR